jgi:hypothetical protein
MFWSPLAAESLYGCPLGVRHWIWPVSFLISSQLETFRVSPGCMNVGTTQPRSCLEKIVMCCE